LYGAYPLNKENRKLSYAAQQLILRKAARCHDQASPGC
jgi:hypothetical protein